MMNPGDAAAASTTLDSTGRIVLPREVRRTLGLATGTRFTVEIVADRIELTPAAPPEPALVRKSGRLILTNTGEHLDAAQAVRAERDALAGRARRA
jgi:AbrB family looped-hinge helix DNA binding protein